MALTLANLSVERRGNRVLQDVTCALPHGAIAIVTGVSGCGKSTLLRAIAGLEPVVRGEIRWCEQLWSSEQYRVPPAQRGIGFVFQELALWPHLRVAQNVAVTLSGLSRRAKHARVAQVLSAVGIEHRATRYPNELSGGEQQRVAIARALARENPVWLLDEPFNQLDRETMRRCATWIAAEQLRQQATVVITSHAPQALSEVFGACVHWRIEAGHVLKEA